jgi:DNA polymerase-4
MILHIDMDAFFASVEKLDDPALKDRCVIVGGRSDRAVVAAACYNARRFGVRSAMPMFQARLKCPQAVIRPVRRHRYKEMSRMVMGVLKNVSPLVQQVSIDEAFVDVTGCRRLFGPPFQIALKIKKEIKQVTGLTCSVGIAPVKFLAKIASDLDKPDGLTEITKDEMDSFLKRLPVHKIPGVGHATQRQLRSLGLRTLGDARSLNDDFLENQLGKFGRRLKALSLGKDNSPVRPSSSMKSVSSETTLRRNTRDHRLLEHELLRQAQDVSRQLRKSGIRAKTVTVKLKHADFRQITRSVTMSKAIQSSDVLYKTACRILRNYPITQDIRLIGLGASGLTGMDAPVQRSLFATAGYRADNWEKVDKVMDSITGKFGQKGIQKASLKNDFPEKE